MAHAAVQLEDKVLDNKPAAASAVLLPRASSTEVAQALVVADYTQLETLDLCLEAIGDVSARMGMCVRSGATADLTALLLAVDEDSCGREGVDSSRTGLTMKNSLFARQTVCACTQCTNALQMSTVVKAVHKTTPAVRLAALSAPGGVLDAAGTAAHAAMMLYVTSLLTALADSYEVSLRWTLYSAMCKVSKKTMLESFLHLSADEYCLAAQSPVKSSAQSAYARSSTRTCPILRCYMPFYHS
eukprot:18061-Heterococcus_DN1.PRE.2